MTVDEDTLVYNALVQNHDAFISSVKSRLTKLEVCFPPPPPAQKQKIIKCPLFHFKKTCNGKLHRLCDISLRKMALKVQLMQLQNYLIILYVIF